MQSAVMSGNVYVPMRSKDEGAGVKPTPTKIASERRCEHLETVCLTCLPQWEEDYVVFFDRTGGGRALAIKKEQV